LGRCDWESWEENLLATTGVTVNLITTLEFPKNIHAKCTSFLGITIADRKFDHFGCSVDGCTYHSYPQGNHQDICGLRRPITSLWPEVRGKGRNGCGCETACYCTCGVILQHGQCEVCVAMYTSAVLKPPLSA